MKFICEEWRSNEGVELPPWDDIFKLDRDFFPNPWTLEQWHELARNGRDSYLIWSPECGFILWELDNFPHAYLLKICVADKVRRQGLASELMHCSIDCLKMHSFEDMALEVEIGNEKAIQFYKKWSFVEMRRVAGFYTDGSDALTMTCSIE